ncbi:MAG: hypothetical protein V1685_03300 [Parcubacteria group bacterium]
MERTYILRIYRRDPNSRELVFHEEREEVADTIHLAFVQMRDKLPSDLVVGSGVMKKLQPK